MDKFEDQPVKPLDFSLLLLMIGACSLFMATVVYIAFEVAEANRCATPTVCEVHLHANHNQTHIYQGAKK